MKRMSILSVLFLASSLAGCGGGDEVSVVTEPPGENCAAGGLKITVNGDSQYACEGEPSEFEITRVAKGAEGNPCLGAAIKVTVSGASPGESYVCSEITEHPIPELEQAGAKMESFYREMGPRQCACEEDEEDRAECEAMVSVQFKLLDFVKSCSIEVFEVTGPPVSGGNFLPYLDCMGRMMDAQRACFAVADDAEADACSPEWEDAFDDCIEAAEAEFEEGDCAEASGGPASPEEGAWFESLEFFSEAMNCPVEYLFYAGLR